MGIFLAIIAFLNKVLDLLNPWSAYWFEKKKRKEAKQQEAGKKMDDAAKKGDFDAFLDGRADKHSA